MSDLVFYRVWVNKLYYIYILKYYVVIKKSEIGLNINMKVFLGNILG